MRTLSGMCAKIVAVSRTFAIILAASLLVVVSLVWYAVSANQNHLVTLKGSVLKVRTLPLTKDATLVLVDFRISDPTKAAFDVKTIELEMDRKNPEIDAKTKLPIPIPGGILTKVDLDRVFEYEKKIGPRENPNLVPGDRINPGQSIDRMIAARTH